MNIALDGAPALAPLSPTPTPSPRSSATSHPTAQAWQQALGDHLAWRGGVDAQLEQLLAQAPSNVMARVLQAWRLVCCRDPRRVRQALDILARVAGQHADRHEQAHLAAIAAAAAGDVAQATALLDQVLAHDPRDLLALSVANTFDHYAGDAHRMRTRVEALLPAWREDDTGFQVVLALHAFALEECGAYEPAERAARAALARDPLDVRAHHVMAHLFEMTGRAEAGLRWFEERSVHHRIDRHLTPHCRWHLALFHLVLGHTRQALAVYDDLAAAPGGVADLIDAAALLWRLQLHGVDIGQRARRLAAAWAPHAEDGFSTFNDLHAMLAFVAARDWTLTRRLEAALVARQATQARYGQTTRAVGLQICRALLAFGRGRHALAIAWLGSLASQSRCIGGSHAQRDVLRLTLQQAVERLRKPALTRSPPVLAAAA